MSGIMVVTISHLAHGNATPRCCWRRGAMRCKLAAQPLSPDAPLLRHASTGRSRRGGVVALVRKSFMSPADTIEPPIEAPPAAKPAFVADVGRPANRRAFLQRMRLPIMG